MTSDNILIFNEKADSIIEDLKEYFKVKYLGDVEHFLISKIQRNNTEMKISQRYMFQKLLEKFNMKDVIDFQPYFN